VAACLATYTLTDLPQGTLHYIINNKLHNCLKITGILNNVFRPQKTLKKTRIKLYNTLSLTVLLYGRETWTVEAKDDGIIIITPILGNLLEYKRN
jgi:hypothetical protein